MKRFDRKFGVDFLSGLPREPAVYLFKDEAGRVLYVGKAKDVRRRLASYRNASRRKAHRKMRAIVRDAASLEVRLSRTEQDALALENELIRLHTPPFNVDGKFDFLYPAIGIARCERHTLLCFTTDTAAWPVDGMRWYGSFRSRPRAKDAFEALVLLLGLVGHEESRAALGPMPRLRGSHLVGVRRLDVALVAALEDFLGGASIDALRLLSLALVDKPRARRQAAEVQSHIRRLQRFFRSDLGPLRGALDQAGVEGSFVSQQERDVLFIRHG